MVVSEDANMRIPEEERVENEVGLQPMPANLIQIYKLFKNESARNGIRNSIFKLDTLFD